MNRRHTYFKNPHVRIQVFHILHNVIILISGPIQIRKSTVEIS